MSKWDLLKYKDNHSGDMKSQYVQYTAKVKTLKLDLWDFNITERIKKAINGIKKKKSIEVEITEKAHCTYPGI